MAHSCLCTKILVSQEHNLRWRKMLGELKFICIYMCLFTHTRFISCPQDLEVNCPSISSLGSLNLCETQTYQYNTCQKAWPPMYQYYHISFCKQIPERVKTIFTRNLCVCNCLQERASWTWAQTFDMGPKLLIGVILNMGF